MKKIVFALIAVTFAGSLCFVSQPSLKAADEAKTLAGKIESKKMTMSRSPSGPYCKMTVAPDSGEKVEFFVMGTTSVTDASGKDLNDGGKMHGAMLLKMGERVEVKYSTITDGSSITNGKNGAESIKALD